MKFILILDNICDWFNNHKEIFWLKYQIINSDKPVQNVKEWTLRSDHFGTAGSVSNQAWVSDEIKLSKFLVTFTALIQIKSQKLGNMVFSWVTV